MPSHYPKNLSIASQLQCFKAVQPEGLLPKCCINYKASSWCPCKFCCVLCIVSRLQLLWVTMSTCHAAWKEKIFYDEKTCDSCGNDLGDNNCRLRIGDYSWFLATSLQMMICTLVLYLLGCMLCNPSWNNHCCSRSWQSAALTSPSPVSLTLCYSPLNLHFLHLIFLQSFLFLFLPLS